MNEDEVINIMKKMLVDYTTANDCGLSNNDFKHEIVAIETVLNMLKEKEQANIELASKLAETEVNFENFKADYNHRCQLAIDRKTEIEKKDNYIKQLELNSDKWFSRYIKQKEEYEKLEKGKGIQIYQLITALAEERGTDEDEIREVFLDD